MSCFRCRNCNQVYENYHPPDDTYLNCTRGLTHITEEPGHQESGFSISKEEDQ